MEINAEEERGEGRGQQHTAAKPMQLHETQNLQQHLSEFPIYQLHDGIAFAALKTNATEINQEKDRNIIHNCGVRQNWEKLSTTITKFLTVHIQTRNLHLLLN